MQLCCNSCIHISPIYHRLTHWPCGPTDKASDYESGDCRFESCQGQKHFFNVYVTKTLKTTILFPLFTLLHSWEVAWKLLKSYCDVDSTNYHVTTAKVVTIYLDIEVNSQILHVSKNLSILQDLNLPSPHPKCNTLSTTLCSPSSQTCLKYKR